MMDKSKEPIKVTEDMHERIRRSFAEDLKRGAVKMYARIQTEPEYWDGNPEPDETTRKRQESILAEQKES
jgi:hypothetical protein